ncbi:MAG: hypothetical protein GY866_04170 [Proteobacteria bacterium]|nr:hypothetical protein [Pseudomonadota bacterium]
MKPHFRDYGTILLLALCFLHLLPYQGVLAVPAYPGPILMKQPDGTRFQARLKGDEWFNWIETGDKKIVVKNRTSGFYEYAVIEKDGEKEVLAPSGIAVGQDGAARSPALNRLKPITRKDLGRLWKAAKRRGIGYFKNRGD